MQVISRKKATMRNDVRDVIGIIEALNIFSYARLVSSTYACPMPSLRIREISVVRGMPRRAAAPALPPITPPLCRITSRI